MSRALDPQLHTHVVAANMSRGADGRYTALHGAALYRAAKTAGYLYQSHLRVLVRGRLGLVWGPVRAAAPRSCRGFQSWCSGVLQAPAGDAARSGGGRDRPSEQVICAGGGAGEPGTEALWGPTHTWREEVRARAGELGLG